MKTIKFKNITLLVLLLVLISSTANAIVPIIINVARIPSIYRNLSALLHGGAIAAGLYGAYSSTRPTQHDTSGGIIRPLDVAWVDMEMIPDVPFPVPVVKEKEINVTIEPGPLKSMADKKDADGNYIYPKIRAALYKENVPGSLKGGDPAGKVGSTPYGWKVVTSSWSGKEQNNPDAAGKTIYDSGSVTTYGAIDSGCTEASGCYGGFGGMSAATSWYTSTSEPPPIEQPNDNSEIHVEMTGHEETGKHDTNSSYQDEIDKMLLDPDYVPKFTDEMDIPYALPSSPLSPEQIAEANAYAQKQAAAVQAQYAAEVLRNAATQSKIEADLARSAATSATTAANADPTNTTLQQAASSADAAARSAESAAAQAAAAAAGASASAAAAEAGAASSGSPPVGGSSVGDGDGEGEEDLAAPIPENEVRKTLDFGPLTALKGALETTYPFNLPSSLKGYYDRLKSEGAAPQFDLPIFGQLVHVDLAVFDPVASVVRFLFGLLATSGLLYYIIHFFRGIS